MEQWILLRNKGLALFRLNKYEEALCCFNEAINANPEYVEAYLDRAKVYAAMKESDEALRDYTKAIEIDPSNIEAYNSRGRCYFDKGDFEKAIADAEEVLKIKADDSNAMALLSDVYHKKSGRWGMLGSGSVTQNVTYVRYKEKFNTLKLTGETKITIERELEKLKQVNEQDIPFNPSDFATIQNYLDTILALPWDDAAPEEISLEEASKILDEDHYGLYDVKNRILEFLAVRKMRQNNKGAILCFAGPPGVGKTSIGKSIARTLGRPFHRFSVGGMNDVSTIRGGRRFYIGAEPGRIIKALIATQSKASVILIDEIDKISVGTGLGGGDPSGAFLEVLDPEQNNSFRDNYIDVPFDLSNVLFILTANDITTLPQPLLDRLEIINIPGYVEVEKLEIAKRYLIPKNLEKNGLLTDQVSYTEEAILHIANAYEKEPGVRTLEQNFDIIHRKLIREIIEAQESGKNKTDQKMILIDKTQVEKYLGEARFGDAAKYVQKADKPGMAVGLVVKGDTWGDTIIIETASIPGEEGYSVTGNIKLVMKESVETAYSYARKFAIEHKYCDRDWFKENHIHIHLPSANPKDGNSAGIAIATALLSLFKNTLVRDKVVMTGEISLTGRVLPIGGLKQKIIGAKNNNAEHIIFPKQNLRDFDQISDVVKEGLQFHSVERFEEVLALVLPN